MAQTVPQTIPEFKFQSLQGTQAFTNANLKSAKYIIFNFYDPGCGHCQKMGAGISKNIDKLNNTQIYFISMNDKEFIDGFINMHTPELKGKANVTFLRDPAVDFIPKFNPSNFPSLYVFDGKTKKLLKHLDGEEDVKKLLAVIK